MNSSISKLFPILDEYIESIILRELGDLKVPIDIEQIVKNYGIQIFYDGMNDRQAGAIIINQNKSGMMINSGDPVCRQRFTMAHELGHFISYTLQNKPGEIIEFRDGTSSLGTNSEEIFANKFAAAILMPKKLLIILVRLVNNDQKLATLLGVSKQALAIRSKNL